MALEEMAETEVSTIYLVDSFGVLCSEQIEYLTRKYLAYARPAEIEVGIHMPIPYRKLLGGASHYGPSFSVGV